MNEFEQRILSAIDNDEEIKEREIRELCWDYEIERIELGEGRWQRNVKSIVQIANRTFAIEWLQGLTENCDSSYNNLPYEVEKHTYDKTITVTEWIEK